MELYEKIKHLREAGMRDLLHTLNCLIMPSLSGYKLRDVKPVHIQRMMAALSGYAHRSQAKALATTRAIFDAAVDNNVILRSPVPSTLKAGGRKAAEKVPLTREQTGRLLAATKGTLVYMPIVLMLGLGLRREEALGLMWADVDFGAHCVHVRRANAFVDSKSIVSEDMKSAPDSSLRPPQS